MQQKNSPMPDFYMQPDGTPVKWQDEQSGTLRDAIKAFFEVKQFGTPFQGMQFALVRDWLRYYINAPCWDGDDAVDDLRREVTALKTPEAIRTWIQACLAIGIDPL